MSIRIRLLLSYTCILIVTIVLFLAAALLFVVAITGDVRSVKDFYNIHYSVNPLTEQEETIFLDLKYMAKNEPDSLLDQELLNQYNYKLRAEQAELFIRKEDKQLYSSLSVKQPAFMEHLPDYEMENNAIRNTLQIGEHFYAYAKFDFYFPDRSKGSVLVVRERSPFAEIVRTLLPIVLGVLFIVLLLMNVLLYYFLTRSIVKPLELLRKSTERITAGNLSFELHAEGNDEIAKLSEAFEVMRGKLKQSVEKQLQYEHNRKELIANITHDLKTPITSIKASIEGIRDGVPDTKQKMERYVNTILTKADDMDQLIDELFLYSKLDLKQLPFTFEPINLGHFIQDYAEDLQFDLQEQGIQLEWSIDTSPDSNVLADRDKLKRVLVNIMDNCVKYMKASPKKISITLQPEQGQLCLTIRDNGPGISEEAVPFVFERFFREDLSRSSQTGGSGLGLAIAKQIIEGHDGSIYAESKLGAGTSIIIVLPPAKQ
ncbi:signal transduction histidine kinase [Paenibacillus endophyticus]|uniref:histidine kinase n=1 Tax=Paenibacillus endophyticus TaxID=1294268 RepID=A0A7W5CD08_9BACL|nr:HAMP domain-containing sensor histidine kinase [Paenibacillus endophyticus]MBB3154859.1 signal transduction histidine kinase [Paenibacillus endophyticus]